MKHLLITTIAVVVLATTAFADPIHDAAKNGDLAGVQAELDKGVDVNAKNVDGETPLHWTASAGHKEIAELLIANGADVNAKNVDGQTPLDVAVDWFNDELADLLRKVGHIEAVKQHLAAGTDVNAKGEYGYTPLHEVAWWGYTEIAELLIAEGADVNAKTNIGETPLDAATHPDNPNDTAETADLLRKHGGKHGTILGAAGGGDIEAVKEFLAAGADVNAKDWMGWTPLHEAADGGHKAIVELLIAEGADVNAKAWGDATPLDSAIRHNHPEITNLLRKHSGKTREELALMPRLVQHGRFAFSFDAKEGKVYEVQDSFDLLNWEVIKIYTGTGDSVRFDEER
ncbi:ankyrin repeat domain-containing protein, partial [bacterium]|nr:ankyrin repeat domain-containing protein [bacterium]